MKKFFALITVLLMSMVLIAETIDVGYFELKPHVFYVEGEEAPRGASVEHLKKIVEKMGYEINWIGPLPFPRLLKYSMAGKIDMQILAIENPEWKEKVFYYPEKHVFEAQPTIAVRRDNDLEKVESIEDILGYRVSFIKGGKMSSFITDNIDKVEMDFLFGKDWMRQSLQKLDKGRIDAVYNLNKYALKFEAVLNNLDNKVKLISLPEKKQKAFHVIPRKGKNSEKLLKEFNEAVKGLKLDYESIFEEEVKHLLEVKK